MKPLFLIYPILLLIIFLQTNISYANTTLDSLQIVLSNVSDKVEKYDILEEYITEQEKLGRAEAIPYVYQQLEVAKALNDPAKVALSQRTLAHNYLLLNKNDSSKYFLDLALPHFEQVRDTSSIAKILNNQALINQRINNYEEAIETYHKVIDLCRAINEYKVELEALVNVASLLINQDKPKQAITYTNKAISRYEQIPHEQDSLLSEIKKRNLSAIYINSGICYDKLQKQDTSSVHKLALQDTALMIYQKALDAIEYGDNEYYANYLKTYVHNNMAYIYRDKEEWKKVKENHELAFQFAKKIENPQSILQGKIGLGGVLVKLKEYHEAQILLSESLLEAKIAGNLEMQVEATKFYAEYFDSIQDYRTSIQYLKSYDTLNELRMNIEREKITEDRLTHYKTKETQDALIISNQNLELEEQKKVRDQIIFLVSLIGILGLGFIMYSRYKLRKERQSAEFEKSLNVAMSRFVPTEFIESIGRNHITEVELGDQIEKEITVIFTDIRNFTARSEKMTATETFQFVKNYAEEMGPIIQKNGGFINQYLGDGVMAVFQNSPEDALIACIEMHERLKEYNKELEANGVEVIEVGMGLHTGPAVMGIIGDEKRRDAAMISDTINTAARMESKTKQYGVKILISEESRIRLTNPELYKLRHIGNVSVKGKKKPIDIYECFNSDHDKMFQIKELTITDFDTAVDEFYSQNFNQAIEIFKKIKEKNPDDKVVQNFIDEIETDFENIQEDILIDKLLVDK